MIHNAVNVRLCNEDGDFKYGMEVGNYYEALKFFYLCKELETPIVCRKFDEEDEREAWVRDIDVSFGNDGNMFSINLYCEIL